MGGFNSGRQGGKRTTNKMTGLDIRQVHRAGRLVPGGFVLTVGGGSLCCGEVGGTLAGIAMI